MKRITLTEAEETAILQIIDAAVRSLGNQVVFAAQHFLAKIKDAEVLTENAKGVTENGNDQATQTGTEASPAGNAEPEGV